MNDDVRAAEYTLGSSETGHNLRYYGDQMATLLAYDTAQSFVSNGTWHTEYDDMFMTVW
jgi:hypothetical protein